MTDIVQPPPHSSFQGIIHNANRSCLLTVLDETQDDKDLSVLMQSHLFWEAPKQIDVLSFQLGEMENKPDLESEKPTAAISLTFWL